MDITIKKQKLYEVENKDGLIEEHFRIYKIGFRSNQQMPLILFYYEDKCETLLYAEVLKSIL